LEDVNRYLKLATLDQFKNSKGKINYFSWGQGPTIVFIHGLADSKDAFVSISSILSQNFRCIGLDIPKVVLGSSTKDQTLLDAYTEFIKDFIETKVKSPVVLFGSSFGSTLSINLASKTPETVSGLILQGGFVHRPLNSIERCSAFLASLFPFNGGTFPYLEFVMKSQHYHAFHGKPSYRWERLVKSVSKAYFSTTGRLAAAINQIDLRQKASDFQKPVLLIDGEVDPLIGPNIRKTLYEAFPNGEKVVIQGGGHLLPYSHPEELAVHMAEFLNKVFPSDRISSAL
jgi:3-oxoadipate enol-lactonase